MLIIDHTALHSGRQRRQAARRRYVRPRSNLKTFGHDTRAIQDWFGHRSIQHTVRYTELTPTRFKDF
jgi:hypothetical protein